MDRTFADLHRGRLPLLLPNAWDLASALSFVAAGHVAVGTTSLGVSAAAGLPDGGRATRASNLALALTYSSSSSSVMARSPLAPQGRHASRRDG